MRYGNTQFRYGMVYIIITFVVLVLLNLYSSRACQRTFYQSKRSTMITKTQLMANALGKLDTLDEDTIGQTMEGLTGLDVDLLVVTDQTGKVLYRTNDTTPAELTPLLEEVPKAMEGYDLFQWDYKNNVTRSEAAIPLISQGFTVGCIYTMETDPDQGALISSLQQTILSITVLLEVVVIIFTLIFANAFSRRTRKIMTSMQILKQGDYSHKVTLTGRDELAYLAGEINDLTQRLQISESKRRRFVSDASHELKTPLASIKLLSDSVLQNEMDPETIREFVGDIGSEAERLIRMSEKLLYLTRGEAIEEQTREITLMAPTIQRVVKMLSLHARSNDVTILTDLQEDVRVLISEDDLYQIAFNLAENGIKYNIPGGTLTIRLYRSEGSGILTVEDTGMGIPEDSLDHIYERFYRVDKARSRATGGSGLGLSIVRSMVDRNQGKISVQSIFGQGTRFTVEFPAIDTEGGEL